jgi:hypothetical protein
LPFGAKAVAGKGDSHLFLFGTFLEFPQWLGEFPIKRIKQRITKEIVWEK